jgi:peptide/nickel transport system substrate-binding protein
LKKILFISLAVIVALGIGLIGCEGEPPAGDPIDLTVLIRTEDEREDIGNYLVTVLEDLGFDVTAQYGISSELGPIWQGEPSLGLWHAYTGGWVSTAVERDSGTNFGFFYTTIGMAWMPVPLWAAYTDEGEFYNLCEALWNNDFSTAGERETMFDDAMWLSMNDSVRIFLLDRTSFSPLQMDVALSADDYGGIYASWLWALTVHFRDGADVAQEPTGNTTLRMSTTDLFIDPWNPVGGSNWAYDMFPIRATAEQSFVYDPTTGLPWPHRVYKANITWKDGLPIIYDADHEEGSPSGRGWLTSQTQADEIVVPANCWADWNPTGGTGGTGAFITTGTRFAGNTTPVTSKVKVVTQYADDIFTVPLHDGSTLDHADFLVYICQWFDRSKSTSPYYDPSAAPAFDAFMSQFKGMEFKTAGLPAGVGLEITTYTDQYYLDAELVCADNQVNWFPHDNAGPFVWHNLALGFLGERDGELAFSQTKADAPPTADWTSFIDGPALPVLADHLADVQNVADPDYRFVPYADVLGPYLTVGEIDARYSNLASWYAAHDNFWVASGPYYLDDVDTLAPIIEFARFTSYPEDGDRWFFTMDPVPTYTGGQTGGWCDVITIEKDTDNAAAVTKLLGDQLDVYAFAISDADLKDTCDANPTVVHYYDNAGSFNDITFNPDGPFFASTGEVNPFALPEVRQAMNMAVNREYIVSDIMSGMAIPRYNCIGSLSGDGVLYVDVLDAIDAFYAYDFDAADAAIEAAMLTITGVTRDVDGTYRY